MNNLCADIGYQSLNHCGEELCGDHVDIVEADGESTVVVLADGLGSGVKASILSTLTSKIISTMMARGLALEDCVETIAATLPVCSARGVAYSTFTILRIAGGNKLEIIQYDNPNVIFIRDGRSIDYPKTETIVGGKKILKSIVSLLESDAFIVMSDGCPHAGIGSAYNFGWRYEDIAEFMAMLIPANYTAKTLAAILIDECRKLYGGLPGDDATACVLRVRKRNPINLLFGPPSSKDDCLRMMNLFFSKAGKHIVCGGTTTSIAAQYLGKKVKPKLSFDGSDIPPIAEMDGVDLVTEGVITMNRVLEYANDHLDADECYGVWGTKRDGASLIARLLFEEATDIHFFVGRAINPAHQNPDLPINFSIKMQIVDSLSECLRKMGKIIKVSYF